MAYVKQGFHDGMTLTHAHLIAMEDGIIAASQGGVEDLYASSYGIIPGKVDATAMAQLLEMASTNNKTIRFNDGEYIFSATIEVPSNVSIVGNTKTVFKPLNATTPQTLMSVVGSDNVFLSHFTLDGGLIARPSAEGTQIGLSISSVRSVNMENIDVIGWSKQGMLVKTTSSYGNVEDGKFFKQMQITNCRFYFNYVGSYFDYRAEYNQMLNCVWGENHVGTINCGGNNAYVSCQWNANDIGFQMENSGSNPAHGGCNGCTFNHNYKDAIQINDCANGWTFEGCQVFYGAIRLNKSKNVVFSGNIWGSCRYYSTGFTDALNQNLITNSCFITDSSAILSGNDGSTFVFNCLPDYLPQVAEEERENVLDDANLTPLFRTATATLAGSDNAYFANSGFKVDANTTISNIYINAYGAGYTTIVNGVNVWVVDGDTNTVVEKLVDNEDMGVYYSNALECFVLNIPVNKTYTHSVYFVVQSKRGAAGIGYTNGTANNGILIANAPNIDDVLTPNSSRAIADITVFAKN